MYSNKDKAILYIFVILLTRTNTATVRYFKQFLGINFHNTLLFFKTLPVGAAVMLVCH